MGFENPIHINQLGEGRPSPRAPSLSINTRSE